MIDSNTQKQLITKIEESIGKQIIAIKKPTLPETDSDVFLVTDKLGIQYAIKYSSNTINDVIAYQLIQQHNLKIPIPKMFGHLSFNNKTVIILKEIDFPLLDQIPVDNHHRYIKSMIDNLNKIHTIKSNNTGFINNQSQTITWKEFLLNIYSNQSPLFKWATIINRDEVDKELIQSSITAIVKKIENQVFIDNSYSLLHTDFNQKNIFVNPSSNEIASIIDWSEAMFGDPLYDFARVRMYIFHFNLQHNSLETYFKLLELTEKEKTLEELYFVIQILNYIGWYSETKNDFNISRITLHQNFLKSYKW